MDKDNLPQEELSKEFNVIGGMAFDHASDAYKPQVREVCRQIREIMEKHFEFIALKKAYGQDRSLDKKAQQKPTVTKAWVNVQAAELMGAFNEYGWKTGMLHVLREVLPEILKEAGVGVE